MTTKQPTDKRPSALANSLTTLFTSLREIEHHALQGLNYPGEERERLRQIRGEIERLVNLLTSVEGN